MFTRTTLSLNSYVLPRTCKISQKVSIRSMHIFRTGNFYLRQRPVKVTRYSPSVVSSFVRNISTEGASSTVVSESLPTNNIVQNIPADAAPPSLLDAIPDAPLPPVIEAADVASVLAEPTFASLGLGGWSPIGLCEQFFELVHVGMGIPWWATISIATVCVRTVIFPLVIKSQQSAAHFHNALPGIQKLQSRITEARTTGDELDAATASQELMLYMKEKNCNPLKNMLVPLVQAPIFISVFFSLKAMTSLPVESLRHGGLWWFTDLTLADPYYLLPLATSATMWVIIRLGIDGPKLDTMGIAKYFVQALPFFIFPFTMTFPAAITWYWLSTNIFTVVQVLFLKLPTVRVFFNIPKHIAHPPKALEKPKKFAAGFKESWKNMKLAREVADRRQVDDVYFKKAGRGPIEKTYAYNPFTEHLKKQKMNKKN